MNIRDDIKHQFMHGNAIMKILLVNVLIYAVQSIFYLIAFFSGYKDEFLDFIRTWFGISSDMNVFITRPWTLFTNVVMTLKIYFIYYQYVIFIFLWENFH
ncbi:MAG: hypothetical protein IPH42_10445 [Bacteroidetes bacterium]|nr:hypothetical protein [Bacteroidota bacterium]